MANQNNRCLSNQRWHDSQGRTYFLPAAALADAACCFACEALPALTCFCEDFFWFALGDLSPMIGIG